MSLGADKVKKAKAQTLKGEFEALRMGETEPLDEFYMKMNGLVINIRALGETLEETYVVKKLLRAVPSKFLQIASAIEQFANLEEMSTEEVIGSLKAHEERFRGQSETSHGKLLLTEEEWRKKENNDGQLLMTREEWQRRTNKEGARGSGEFRGRNGGRGPRDRSQVRCYNCQEFGHFANECRKPRRERDNQVNLTRIQEDEPALLIAEKVGKMLLKKEMITPQFRTETDGQRESQVWYLDNGASNHMTGQRGKFKELDERVIGEVKFGDGSKVSIEGKGAVSFKCKNGEEKILKDVYYIPTLCNNIISLGQLSEEGNRVVMNGDYLWVYDNNERLLMKVKKSGNRLYKISLEESAPMCLLNNAEEETWLWHARLGHVNFQAMEMMAKEQMVYGLPKLKQPAKKCEGCLMSKQTRQSFPSQANFQANKVLELIHGDICGPISPSTPAGNRYFFLLVDDYSRKMWVYMLKQKSEAFSAFKKFKLIVENRVNQKIKIFRTDRGGEFCSNEFEKFCEDTGIQRHYTAPYTPQQNGVVERRNRTVAAMTRSFLKGAKLPPFMWGEAVRHSIYVLNRLPTRVLRGRTPYEAWTGSKPDLYHLKMFGSIAYMKIPAVYTQKLDDRSKLVIFLGKEPGYKASRLYDPNKDIICVSRDVVVQEGKFWNWEKQSEQVGCEIVFPGFETENDAEHNDEEASETGNEEPGSGMNTSSNVSTPARSYGSMSTKASSESETSEQESATSDQESETSSASSEPRKFRRLSDIYNNTEEIELDDDMLLLSVEEPATFDQAVLEKEWRQAMKTELEAIERNDTWELTDLPKGHKAIGLKWVYKIKKDSNGMIVKHKARLVAKGYVQKQGVDFEEAFAPVTRLEIVRLLLALAATNSWEVHHLDVKSAFLNGEIEEEVYVSQPTGYEVKGQEGKVYKLRKALYGLRQAPRAWYTRLSKFLEKLGFEKCPYEHAVYVKREGNESLIIGVYVDDILITSSNTANIIKFKEQMSKEFEMSDLGKLSYYLGIEVDQSKDHIELKQSTYAKKVLEAAGMADCNPSKYPMEPKIQLHKDLKGKAVDSSRYRSIVGGLRYLVHTRPDIAYAVGMVNRFMERPTTLHLGDVKRVLRYIKGTINYGLVYSKSTGNHMLSGYSDSDFAGNSDDRRSTGGMVFYLSESLITWMSQKQRCVALSSCEAEFMAATAAACQGLWLQKLLSRVIEMKVKPITLYVDNRSAIDLAKNPVFHGRRKHIDVRFHFIRDCVERGDVIIKHVSSGDQRADVLTKPMSAVKFVRMRELLGIKKLAENA